jgi:SpoVK/Ycf46/Vps4 family AAA+-type ATPase
VTSQHSEKTTEALIKDERDKGHRILADRLEKVLQASSSQSSSLRSSLQATKQHQADGLAQKDLVFESTPERSMDSLVLTEGIRAQLSEIVEEQHRSELLHAHGLSPRHRVLLAGPPGNGKTSVAEALAFELMVPLIVVRYESLIGSYLGETSARLKTLLDYAKNAAMCAVL